MVTTRRALLCILLVLMAAPLAAQISDVYVVPAVADAQGAAGTRWMSSFYLMNPQSYELIVTLVYLPSAGAEGSTFDFRLPGNATAAVENIVAEFGPQAVGTGSLLVAVFPDLNPSVPDNIAARSVVLQTRTFNLTSAGTLGQGIPGAITGLLDYEFDGLSAIATGIRNIGAPGVSGFRANVGATNLGRSSVVLRVLGFNEDGQEVGFSSFTVPPQGHVQDLLPFTIDQGSLEFWVEDPSPSDEDFVFPYVSVVDNRTGDPTYIEPKLLATPRAVFPFKTAARTSDSRLRPDQVRAVVQSSRPVAPESVPASALNRVASSR